MRRRRLRERDIAVLRINRRLLGSNGVQVDKSEPGLLFAVGSSVIAGAMWGLEALGMPSVFLVVKGEGSRKCCEGLTGGRSTGSCRSNLCCGWGNLVSWGQLGQIRDSRA